MQNLVLHSLTRLSAGGDICSHREPILDKGRLVAGSSTDLCIHSAIGDMEKHGPGRSSAEDATASERCFTHSPSTGTAGFCPLDLEVEYMGKWRRQNAIKHETNLPSQFLMAFGTVIL